MGKFANYIVSSLGIGSFIYLCTLVGKNERVSTATVLFVFLISVGIGITAWIFENENLSFLTCLCIHYVITNLIVCLLGYLLLRLSITWELIGSIFVMYLIAYVITYYKMKLTEKKLNRLLQERSR